jgi:hypothetical protein
MPAPVGHEEGGEATDQRLDGAPAADVQLATEIKNLCEKLAVAFARNNGFERGAEEDKMEPDVVDGKIAANWPCTSVARYST